MKNCSNTWTDQDNNKLSNALTFCYKNSDLYGQALELESRMNAFKFVLEGEYTMNQVLLAFKMHMGKTTEMIKPAHVNALLSPAKAKITQTEFINAKNMWEIGGYKTFCEYKDVMDAFTEQEHEQRESHEVITDERALELMNKFKSKDEKSVVTSPDGYKKLN